MKSIRSRSTQLDNRVTKRARTRTKSFPLEDSSLFAYLNTFMTTDDLMQLWKCSRAVRTMVLPNIVPRVEWGPEVLNRPELRPLVRRMHTGDEFDHPLDVGSLPPCRRPSVQYYPNACADPWYHGYTGARPYTQMAEHQTRASSCIRRW